MKKLLYIIPLVLIAIVAIGYGVTKRGNKTSYDSVSSTAGTPMAQPENKAVAKKMVGDEHGVKLAGTRIDLQNTNNLKPGSVTLAFKLYGIDAHEFGPDDLKIAHGKLMHLILVRDDVTGFQHLHPEYQDGRWTVATNIPAQGVYQMYVDIEPKEEKPTTLRVPITVGGPTEKVQFPEVSTDMSATVGDITVALQTDSSLKTKEETKMIFVLTQNSKPVTQINPYLGAFGHVVLLRHTEASHYLHAHPITKTNPTDGKVVFETEFPTTGTYTIFAQFSVNGQVKTFPITVKIGNVGQAGLDVSGH